MGRKTEVPHRGGLMDPTRVTHLHSLSLSAGCVQQGHHVPRVTAGSRPLLACSSYWIDARHHVSQGVSYTIYAQNIIHGDHEEV